MLLSEYTQIHLWLFALIPEGLAVNDLNGGHHLKNEKKLLIFAKMNREKVFFANDISEVGNLS
ncbi:MAG TPA: hypothetical protein DCS93_41785 [Microscillaceae bacterium]|nr:hypothetical protein [Microscillaceae bacterium]